VSPALDAMTQTQLKRLCSGILSTLGLAVARVRVYGQFTRAQKIVRLMRYAATESKFDELRSDLAGWCQMKPVLKQVQLPPLRGLATRSLTVCSWFTHSRHIMLNPC